MPNPLSDLGVTDAEIQAILASPEVTDAKLRLAEKIKERWRAISPVDTGRYRDSIHVEVGADQVVRIVADTPYAGYLEYGTEDTPEMALRTQTEAYFAAREDI